MEFNVEELRGYFLSRIIGRRIEYYEELESTNTEALRLALEDAPEGTVVIADGQSEGRGRLDRIWESPPSMNLYLSVVLRPDIPAASASLIPLAVGVAVADLISRYCPGRVRLKWPNDVLLDGRKICGILTEMRTRADRVHFIIVGIGVNINMRKLDFSREIRETATSLRIGTECEIERLDVAIRLFEFLERWYRIFLSGGQDHIREKLAAIRRHHRQEDRSRFQELTPSGGPSWVSMKTGPFCSRGKPACSRFLPAMSISRGCDHASGNRRGKQQYRPGTL